MHPALVVIDTQSLFDWLIFRHPVCARWHERLGSGGWRWIFTPPMKAEFDFVAAKGFGERWPLPAQAVAEAWATLARAVDVPSPPGAADRLHCTDPDDQKFIDLAIAAGAHTLVTRDKALLRLARKASARHRIHIVPPGAWDGEPPSSDGAD